jgi:Xaa-Pro aminopeptidase
MIPQRLTALRALMEREGVQAYMIPSTDPHHSEYLPDCWKRRQWISGFTGSAGDVVVGTETAGLWTDGRYFLQAADQLMGSGITLMKMGQPDTPSIEKWVGDQLSPGEKFGIDPKLVSVDSAKKMAKELEEKGIEIKYIESNLIDEIWLDRPSPSNSMIEVLDTAFTGESAADKLDRIRGALAGKNCSYHILGALDTIAWTLNLRGKDIDYNPLFISYAFITPDEAHLFVNTCKVSSEMKEALGERVIIHSYDVFGSFLSGIGSADPQPPESKIWIDPATTNQWIMLKLGEHVTVHQERSPVVDLKSVKNDTELQGMRDAHVQDGIAMVRFLKWLGETVPKGTVTENSAADALEKFRTQGEHFVGLSFNTIAGFADHGAIIHYDPAQATGETFLKPDGIFLVDSGGQYRNGTTDITRTITLGNPTSDQREMFTRVLMGHINLSRTRFPSIYTGRQIEFPARKSLWDAGKNYNHGTGHGVGHYLNVHEGPMSISPRDTGIPLKPGNILSNEPGYYKEGEYGIRIENLVAVIEDEELSSEGMQMLGFDTITMCPIDLELVESSIMTDGEKEWLNSYHRCVFDILSPHLDEEHRAWLEDRTRAI